MPALPRPAQHALDEVVNRVDSSVVGLVLTGSAARGMATDRSDVDVYVVYGADTTPTRNVRRTAAIDEIPVTLAELEHRAVFGTGGWWFRWSFAWAQMLRDETGGRVAAAVRRQATLLPAEQAAVLGERLDGYINFVYRALKADRDGRPLERRLDAAESVPWLLDVIFTLAGRVRPYNKYLPWELREHPISVAEWSAELLLPRLGPILDGDPAALRSTYAVVERECLAYDADGGGSTCSTTFDSWGVGLDLIRARC